jgi:hypothetical protein
VGKALRIYDIGKKKNCCEMPRTRSVVTAQSFESIAHLHQTFGLAVVTLNTQGFRILVGDMQESVSSPFIKLQKIACSFSRTTVSHWLPESVIYNLRVGRSSLVQSWNLYWSPCYPKTRTKTRLSATTDHDTRCLFWLESYLLGKRNSKGDKIANAFNSGCLACSVVPDIDVAFA